MDRIKLFLVWVIVVFTSAGAFAAPYSIPKDGTRRMWNEGANSWCSYINPLFNYFDAAGGVLPEYPVVLGPLSVSGAGDSWLELGNNTSFTDVLTGKGGYGLLNWLPYAILNGEQKRIALFEELGSFAFDTFPTYEDSTHSSGIAVNGTTLAVYSETASKWLTVALTDSLEPEPVLHTLTVTDPGNADVISSTDTFIDCGDGATDCTHDYVATSTPELTYTAAAGRTFTTWTGDATDTSASTNPDTITMNEAKAISGTSAVVVTCSGNYGDTSTSASVANALNGQIVAVRVPLSCAGTITSISAYLQYAAEVSREIEFGIYADNGSGTDPGALIGNYGPKYDAATASASAWVSDTISQAVGNVDYVWVAIAFEATQTWFTYDAGTQQSRSMASTFGTWPETWDTATDTAYTNRDWSIYVTFP